jgi:BirA family biotin operon repressor/biotin-[acetyl-CoA-carboxylase] ligase
MGQLSFVAAVASAAAIGAGVPILFKWPNDLLIERRKIGGILIEAEAEGAVVGLGVNVASAPEGTPYPATSLVEAGREGLDVRDLLVEVCRAFETWYVRWQREGFAPIREAWLARAAGVGEPISVRTGEGEVAGVFAALDEEGALVLETKGGSRRIKSGEVFFGPDRCC